ncbi:Plant intracellular ras group-related LRR 4 [Hibiscus syriacus]|uniref:Plant intracellular ras group-related LRR 4 n=1 Tax=Hibiscus syriacus TaxID=106335 RepID=A0A6A2XZZ8_HIBSY|nr:Plant intracellular ras group-related LRR 4 [Hibiscus syriacus]
MNSTISVSSTAPPSLPPPRPTSPPPPPLKSLFLCLTNTDLHFLPFGTVSLDTLKLLFSMSDLLIGLICSAQGSSACTKSNGFKWIEIREHEEILEAYLAVLRICIVVTAIWNKKVNTWKLLKYTPAIDMWSIRCVFAEILTGKPLFPGKNMVHQLDLMTNMLGTPPPESISRSFRMGSILIYVFACLSTISPPPPYFLDKLKLPCGLERNGQVLSRAVVIYVENMLKLESGEIGELVGSTMLMVVVDRLIELDVEIEWDAILQDDFSKGIFEMELEDMDDIEENDEPDVGEMELILQFRLSRKSLAGNSIAELLDNLLVLTFEHIESCEREGRLTKVFETLLQSFQITILNVYKSKFAQFVIFYACALDPENYGMRFATMLLDAILDF